MNKRRSVEKGVDVAIIVFWLAFALLVLLTKDSAHIDTLVPR